MCIVWPIWRKFYIKPLLFQQMYIITFQGWYCADLSYIISIFHFHQVMMIQNLFDFISLNIMQTFIDFVFHLIQVESIYQARIYLWNNFLCMFSGWSFGSFLTTAFKSSTLMVLSSFYLDFLNWNRQLQMF